MNKIRRVKIFYDEDSDRYVEDRYNGETSEHFAYKSRQKIVLKMLENCKGNILDIGSGPGIYTHHLIKQGLTAYSVDLSLKMLDLLFRSTCNAKNKNFCLNAELEKLCFKNESFDNVLAVGVLAYAQDTNVALQEIYRVLRPQGTLIVQSSNPFCPNTLLQRAFFATRLKKKNYSFRLTKHSQSKFVRILEQSGFSYREHRNYDFRVPLLHKISEGAALSTMKKLYSAFETSTYCAWFAEGYVIKASKKQTETD